MKVGTLVKIKPHIDFDVTKTLFTKPSVGIIKGTLSGAGYCDVLLFNGRTLFLSTRYLEVLSGSR